MKTLLITCMMLIASVSWAVSGDVCAVVADCQNVNLDLGTLNENSDPITMYFDFNAQIQDPINPCGYVWTAVFVSSAFEPDTLTPTRSPVGGNGVGTCQVTGAAPTLEVPTADSRITCSLLDDNPAANPSGPDQDPLQGELSLPFSVPANAPSFSGPAIAFESLSVRVWDAGAGECVVAGTPGNTFTGPPTLNSLTVVGQEVDFDLDGVVDTADNCIEHQNGPFAFPGECQTQLDGDSDGFGNACDTDIDNDGATSINDAIAIFEAAQAVSTDPVFDIDCDGAASLNDAIRGFEDAQAVAEPGPSCCAP